MALIQAVGQISRFSAQHNTLLPLKQYKSLLLLKKSLSSLNLSKNVHVLTETCRYQAPWRVHHCHVRKTFSLKYLNQIISRTLSSTVNGKHPVPVLRPLLVLTRHASTQGRGPSSKSNQTALIYIVAIFVFMIGAAYAGVPLYKVFCQVRVFC